MTNTTSNRIKFHVKIWFIIQKSYKLIVIYFLYPIAGFIISLDLGPSKPKIKSARKRFFSSSYFDPSIDPTFSPDLPPANKLVLYKQLLKQAKLKGKPIKPIHKHKRPVPEGLSCPKCGATAKYIYNGGTKYSKGAKKRLPNFLCKICRRQWFPDCKRPYTSLLCPFCSRLLHLKRSRKEFDLYLCRRKDCEFFKEHKTYYKYRSFKFDLKQLQISSPSKSKVNLSNIHYPPSVLGLVLVLCINFGLTFRNASLFLSQIFGIKISHVTIYYWCCALANLAFPLISKLPINAGNLLAIDETYERYNGKWGYFYACIEPHLKAIMAPHFSPKRNVKAVSATLLAAIKRYPKVPETIYVVHDCHRSYFLAIQLINQFTNYRLRSLPVKGLKDNPPLFNPYRMYKNIMERFFGTAKPAYYQRRGFGSFDGAVVFNVLFSFHYNYFKEHESLDGNTPIQIPNLTSNNPIHKWNKLISLALQPQYSLPL